jgi:hypothetical protein
MCDKLTLKTSANYEDNDSKLVELRSSVVQYTQPTKSVGIDDWEAIQR